MRDIAKIGAQDGSVRIALRRRSGSPVTAEHLELVRARSPRTAHVRARVFFNIAFPGAYLLLSLLSVALSTVR